MRVRLIASDVGGPGRRPASLLVGRRRRRRVLAAIAAVASMAAMVGHPDPASSERRHAASPDGRETVASAATAADAGRIRVSRLVGSMVFGPQGQRVGTVDDVLVDASGRVVAVTLDVGAFLGVATRTVAVPMALLSLVPAAEAAHRKTPPAPTAPAGKSAAGLLEDLMTRTPTRWQASPADHVEVSLSRQDLAGMPAYAGD